MIRDLIDGCELRQTLERQKCTFDLAMTASQMGTWRYTLADNICMYDENAQALYGLSAARFLHDEEGVKFKFHPDDLELMWSRVGKALDPRGDGRYDVEYRVRQLDGSWRWLSGWGLVEFEGDGPERKPVAIVGASRDLTKLKQAEAQQQLLLNELNHRIKNTLATIQAITAQTLRTASDLPSARQAVDQRICSMAQAHARSQAETPMTACLGRTRNHLLAALPQTDFAMLAPDLTTVHLERDAVLLRIGSKIDYVYFPHGGAVSLMLDMSNGETAATGVLGRESAIGMLSALGPAHSPVTAVVRVATTASQLPASRFHTAFRQSAAIRHIVQTHAMALLAQLQQVAACNALHPVDARLARWLLHIQDRLGSNTIPLTHEVLAQLLGVRRTTVTLALNKLRKLGAIRLNRRGQIEIDRANLEGITCECYVTMRHIVDRDILEAATPPVHAMHAHDIPVHVTLPTARGEIRKVRD